jgi:hypothetical protein
MQISEKHKTRVSMVNGKMLIRMSQHCDGNFLPNKNLCGEEVTGIKCMGQSLIPKETIRSHIVSQLESSQKKISPYRENVCLRSTSLTFGSNPPRNT